MLTLEAAMSELREALAGPEDDVFYDVIALSDRLLRSGLPDAELATWADVASRGILDREIPPDKLVCYDTLDPRFSRLIFSIPDTELGQLWPRVSLPNLRIAMLGEADIDWNQMPDCSWSLLAKLSVYSGPGVAKGLLAWLARQDLPALREFRMFKAGASPADFAALTRASYWAGLEDVDVSHNNLRGPWPAMPAAQSLVLAHTQATTEDVHRLLSAPMPQLARLDISENEIDNRGFDLLAQSSFPSLKTFAARSCEFTDGHAWRGLARAQWPNLLHLELQDSLRDPQPLRSVDSVLRRLVTLKLRSCSLDDVGGDALARIDLPMLEQLDLSFNELTDKGAASLAAAPWSRLKHLALSVNPIGDRGVAALSRAPWWGSLETLELINAELTDAGLALLSHALPPMLSKLRLGPEKRFSPEAYAALRRALPAGASL